MMPGPIVDMTGAPVQSGEKGVVKRAPVAVTGLIVVATCTDGVMRKLKFTPKQAKKTVGYIKANGGGKLCLEPEPIYVFEKKPVEITEGANGS